MYLYCWGCTSSVEDVPLLLRMYLYCWGCTSSVENVPLLLRMHLCCWGCTSIVESVQVQCFFTAAWTIRNIRDVEPRTATSTFTQLPSSVEDVPLVDFMYLVFTRMPGESYRRWLRSSLLYLCDVIRALINSLVCWYPAPVGGGVYSVHDSAARDACGLLRSIVCCCWCIVPNESPVHDVLYRTKDCKYTVFIIFDRTELGFNALQPWRLYRGDVLNRPR